MAATSARAAPVGTAQPESTQGFTTIALGLPKMRKVPFTTLELMGALIANAIYDATGARLWQLPMTPDRIKAALKSV